MYQYNNPRNDNVSPIPSARQPMRPRFNTGEEYSMNQTSFSSSNTAYSPSNDALGYYESSIPGSNNNMQRPLLGTPNNSGVSTATFVSGNSYGNQKSNMFGGGPEDFGMAPRRQQRRYKTGKQTCQDRERES